MKKIIYLLAITFLTVNVNAQLTNSKWKTTLQLDQPVEVVFNFAADTLDVTNTADNSSMETMKYAMKDTILTMQKLYGQSECDTAVIGTYSCIITGDEMWLKMVSDDCYDRSSVIRDIKLTKTQ